MTAGFFGLSQAGKSYLISSLAADENGKLLTDFDGEELDFVEHLNPEGGGKEATGIVTRFSRQLDLRRVPGYPLELKIFSEIEMAKIFINSFFNDFNQEKFDYQCTQERVNAVLKQVSGKVGSLETGITEDDVVDLQDYVMDNFGKSTAVLNANYWKRATELAPRLKPADRAVLFSVLWGEVEAFGQAYIRFAELFSRLGHAKTVFAPIKAAIKYTDEGKLSKVDSIMNVDMIARLDTSRDESIDVRPLLAEGEVGEVVTITLAELTSITAELVFPLKKEPRVPIVEKIDLLDFPGYRGRMDVKDINSDFTLAGAILRGKVAYLFERYTDSQEMNILVMCTPSNAQSEINEIGPVLERWINKTQGSDPEVRGARNPGLLWAITKFDIRLSTDLSKSEENLKAAWGSGGLLQQTILERFGTYDWFKNWSVGKPFNNVFLVRKPGFKVAFLQMAGDKELAIAEQEANQLDIMRRTFIQDPEILAHVNEPGRRWDEMLALNDGGMKGVSDYLSTIASVEYKQKRIIEQLNEKIALVQQRFEQWYQSDGADAVMKQRKLAQDIATVLKKRAILLGELLHLLQLPRETIFSLYHADTVMDISEESTTPEMNDSFALGGTEFDFGGDFDLFGEAPVEMSASVEKAPIAQVQRSPFAHACFKAWIEHMNKVSSQEGVQRFFQLNAESIKLIDAMVQEIKTGAVRMKLEERLTQAVIENEKKAYKRDQIVERQVFVVHSLLSDFLAWLGCHELDNSKRPASLINAEMKVFEQRAGVLDEQDLPKLDDKTAKFAQSYIFDWFVAFGYLCEQNAGHSAGREIDATQNAKLGEVLSTFTLAKQEA